MPDNNYDPENFINKLKEYCSHVNDAEHPAFDTLIQLLGQTLLNPLAAILGITQTLQSQALSPAQQKDYFAHITQLCNETLTLINQFINYSRSYPTNDKETESKSSKLEISYAELKDICTLLIDDDHARRDVILKQLKMLGLECTVSDSDAALQILYNTQKNQKPYQIAVIAAQHFDHHISYLGRTIKSNPKLAHVMPVLALPADLPDFEIERAHFSGFACVVNIQKPNRLGSKLLNSWHSWATKMNFTQAEKPVTKNLILVVEDDPIPQKVTKRQLAELGYQVDTASDGRTALKYLEQKVYDLVFMDIGLPDISGLEVTAEFRKRESNLHHTPIIGLTMHALGSDQETGLQAGMDEYIVKPLLHDRLKIILKTWVTDKAAK